MELVRRDELRGMEKSVQGEEKLGVSELVVGRSRESGKERIAQVRTGLLPTFGW